MQEKLSESFMQVRKILCDTYEPFLLDKPEIQKVWFKYVSLRDSRIEEALKKAVKNSLQELHKVVGDDKIPAIAIFKLSVEIENQKLVFKPDTDYLHRMFEITIQSMIQILRNFRKMEVVMHEERKKRIEEHRLLKEKELKQNPMLAQRRGYDQQNYQCEEFSSKDNEAYYLSISADKDVDNMAVKILANLKKTCDSLVKGSLTDPWKKQQIYWSNAGPREKFVEYLLKPGEDIHNTKSLIEKLELDQMEIQSQKTTEKIGCIVLDNTMIKSAIVDLLYSQQKTTLMTVHKIASQDLNKLYDYFSQNELTLRPQPYDHQQLKHSMDVLNECKAQKKEKEASLKPIEDKFKLLEDYQQTLKEEEMQRKNNLREALNEFNLMLDSIEARNAKVYQEFFQETMKSLIEFQKDTSDNKIHFQANAPFQCGNLTNEKAFNMLNEYKENVKLLRNKEDKMKFSFDLFKINYAPSPDLETVEKEIDSLEKIWKIKQEYDNQWEQIQQIKFKDFNNDELDDLADEYLTKINQQPKEVKKWEIISYIKNQIEQFRQTLPLIKMLREKYMRPRHWDRLQKQLGAILDYESDTFTLQEIFRINLLNYQEQVREACEVAREEYKIESALALIDTKWQQLNLVMDEHPTKKVCNNLKNRSYSKLK
eukprot:TRINITY_DN71_c0_g1_i2.p1 TRINITY_DN71_c0_g1~~TRINITY_DN71_c0_g1_i2.p1  ORF type:complete len:652 (-),score=150.25 TRINITY_DN71_c0_g1_i2:404-2359(-)